MSEEEREILQGLDDMKHLEINPEYKVKIINGILDLYNKEKEYAMGLYYDNQGLQQDLDKEKEKNKELEEYANWHIEHLTEDIVDYIDDDRKGNASIIGEFKEEREHWKDIIRIMNNEKTYIDYKIY